MRFVKLGWMVCALGALLGSCGGGGDGDAIAPGTGPKLTAADGGLGDSFGISVAINGDTVIVGAYESDDSGTDSGSAYVFVRSGGVWTEQQKLLAADGGLEDAFGISVAISGDTAVVGAPGDDDSGDGSGSAYVFVRSGGVWTEQQKLLAADGGLGDSFGISVAINGDTAIVGAYRDGDVSAPGSGSAYVFVRSGGVWTEQDKLLPADRFREDYFGCSVAISGDTAIVGAFEDDDAGNNSGSAYVFVRSGGVWSEQQKLLAADGFADDYFGISVAINGDTAIVGAYESDGSGTDSGSAYVFVRSGGVWSEQQKLLAADGTGGERFGRSVAISGDTAIVGAFEDGDAGIASGSAYVFVRSGGVWSEQQKLLAADGTGGERFGRSVAISGDTAIIGAYGDDDAGNNSGSAYVY